MNNAWILSIKYYLFNVYTNMLSQIRTGEIALEIRCTGTTTKTIHIMVDSALKLIQTADIRDNTILFAFFLKHVVLEELPASTIEFLC